jgi:pre-rRNA-processing protein TSR1
MLLNNTEDVSQVLRYACGSKLKSIKWRENRPFMLLDTLNYSVTTNSLQVSGYLRGATINVNNLVHITDIGDFQLENIKRHTDPYKNSKFINSAITIVESKDMNSSEEIVAVADSTLQESLDTENPFDPFASDQTWPTDQEIVDSKNITCKYPPLNFVIDHIFKLKTKPRKS